MWGKEKRKDYQWKGKIHKKSGQGKRKIEQLLERQLGYEKGMVDAGYKQERKGKPKVPETPSCRTFMHVCTYTRKERIMQNTLEKYLIISYHSLLCSLDFV